MSASLKHRLPHLILLHIPDYQKEPVQSPYWAQNTRGTNVEAGTKPGVLDAADGDSFAPDGRSPMAAEAGRGTSATYAGSLCDVLLAQIGRANTRVGGCTQMSYTGAEAHGAFGRQDRVGNMGLSSSFASPLRILTRARVKAAVIGKASWSASAGAGLKKSERAQESGGTGMGSVFQERRAHDRCDCGDHIAAGLQHVHCISSHRHCHTLGFGVPFHSGETEMVFPQEHLALRCQQGRRPKMLMMAVTSFGFVGNRRETACALDLVRSLEDEQRPGVRS